MSGVKLIDPITGLEYRAGGAAGADGSSATAPLNTTARGAANFATTQAASSVSPAAATLIVAARSGRHSVVLSNITGTQPVYFVTSNVTTGTTTGFFLAGTAGASVTISTAAAIYATSPTAAQTISVLETY